MAIQTTATFRDILHARAQPYPPPRSASSSDARAASLRKRKGSVDFNPVGGWVDGKTTTTSDDPSDRPRRQEDAFLKEAYQILNHLQTFLTQLSTIRRQYLALPSSSDKGKSREQPRFGDKDREEFDFRSKLFLKNCLERILALEREEEKSSRGKKKVGNEPESTANRVLQLLIPPSLQPLLPSSSSSVSATLIAAHHASILYYLQSHLSKAGSTLSSLQEERMRRLEQADRSLGGRAALLSAGTARTSTGGAGGSAGKESFVLPDAPVVKREGEEALSADMMEMFEQENAELMQGFNSHLDQIQKTQSALEQISTLQSLLSQSLMQQAEVSERLLLEAGQGVADVKAGNDQLRKANERASSSTLMILVFLIGASLALLFVDWYR